MALGCVCVWVWVGGGLLTNLGAGDIWGDLPGNPGRPGSPAWPGMLRGPSGPGWPFIPGNPSRPGIPSRPGSPFIPGVPSKPFNPAINKTNHVRTPAPNFIKHFHWLITLFWQIRSDVTIVSIGNNCNIKHDWPESQFEIVVKSSLIGQNHAENKENPLYNWVLAVSICCYVLPCFTSLWGLPRDHDFYIMLCFVFQNTLKLN